MGNHKMKGFVVGFYVAIFALLKLSLQEQMEGDVVAGLISVDQSKAGDYAAGEAPQVFQIKAKAHNNPDFKPTKCVAKGPDGTKYEMKPGATFKDKKIKCLCDCIILPPTECGVAFTCIDSSMEGTWNVTMYNSNGDIIIVQQSVKQHSLTCTFHPVDGQWGEWGSWSEECEGEHQKRTRKCDSPPPSQHPRGKDCVGPSQDLRPCPPKDCPSAEWELHGEFCYRFVDKDLSWIDAWHHCKNEEDAHLASIHSHEENCILSCLGKAGTRFPFWLDGRFIEEGTDDKGKIGYGQTAPNSTSQNGNKDPTREVVVRVMANLRKPQDMTASRVESL